MDDAVGAARDEPSRTFAPDCEALTIVMELCDDLQRLGGHFTAVGFDAANWPVDVRTDLAVLIEQLPGAIDCLYSGTAFSLDFYEQGIERAVHFTPTDAVTYLAQCESRNGWRPQWTEESTPRAALASMFEEVLARFLRFALIRSPRLLDSPTLGAFLSSADAAVRARLRQH